MIQGTQNLREFKISPTGQTKKQSEFITSVIDKVERSIFVNCLGSDEIYEVIESESVWVEVYMNRKGKSRVDVIHKHNEHESPLVEFAISNSLPAWSDVLEEAEKEHNEEKEFRNELLRSSIYW